MPGAQGVPAVGIAFIDFIVICTASMLWSAREISAKKFLSIMLVLVLSYWMFIGKWFCS